MKVRSLALAIPAYNEADGIGGFIAELDDWLAAHVESHTFCVVDDASTDATAEVLAGLATKGTLDATTSAANQGHGPTVLDAYRRALETGADWVLQVDGDGQFEVPDIGLLLQAADRGAMIATGRRMTRSDPWFRRVVTFTLPLALRLVFGARRRDVNCPFRLYRSDVLEELLTQVPSDSLTPHVLLTVLEHRSGLPHAEVPVRHRPRRGDSETGTMWRRPGSAVALRLVKFCGRAARQLISFRFALR